MKYALVAAATLAVLGLLAGSIHSLGDTPADLLCRARDGNGFSGFDQHLPSLGRALEMHTQRHLAYPVLHYFHSAERRSALGPAVASSTMPSS